MGSRGRAAGHQPTGGDMVDRVSIKWLDYPATHRIIARPAPDGRRPSRRADAAALAAGEFAGRRPPRGAERGGRARDRRAAEDRTAAPHRYGEPAVRRHPWW